MKTLLFSNLPSRLVLIGMVCGAIAISCAGCQTFNLSKEEFEKQQRGEAADPATANVMDTIGTLGYFGTILGTTINGLAK